MIRLFDDDELLFSTLGLGVLKDAKSCIVTEGLNDTLEVEMIYPIDGQFYSKLKINRIICCKVTPYSNSQAFRINRISKPINGLVTINAVHISYDMNGIIVAPFSGKTIKDVVDKIQNGSILAHHFNIYTDKNDTKSFKTANYYNMRSLLLGSSDSVLEKYEGEIYFDNFNTYILKQRGSNRGAQVRYAKNLKDITHEISYEKLYNAVYPFYHKETSTTTTTTAANEFTKVYIVGSKPYQDGWLSYSKNGEAYHPIDETPVQIATEGDYYEKVYSWNSTTERYVEKKYNEMVSLIDSVGNLLSSNNTPSWIYIDWSSLPAFVCKANVDGYFKLVTETEWTQRKKGDIIIESSITEVASNLIMYYSEVIPMTKSSNTEETSTVTHVQLSENNGLIYLETDAAKEMKFDRILALDLTNEFDDDDTTSSSSTTSSSDEKVPTVEQLEVKAKEYIEKNKIGQYKYNTTLSFIDLSTTTEGVEYENIEVIELGDTVKVVYDDLGINIDLRVITTTYNVLLDRYEKIELGEKSDKLSGESIQNGDDISSLTNDIGYADINTVNKLIAKMITADYIQAKNASLTKAQIEELSTARIKVSGMLEASQFEVDQLVAKLLTADNAVIKETLEAGTVKVRGDISVVKGEINISSVDNDNNTITFKVDREGNVTANSVKITGGEFNINNQFSVTNDGILTAKGAEIQGTIIINSGSIKLGDKFEVTEDGTVTATGATISGEIHAETGVIGGFTINSDKMYAGNSGSRIIIAPEFNANANLFDIPGMPTNMPWSLLAGLSFNIVNNVPVYISAKFGVTSSGYLYAKSANIQGTITSNNCTITGGSISIKNSSDVVTFNVTNQGAVTASNINITGGQFNINDNFIVTNTGLVTAKGITIQNGSITIGATGTNYILDSLDVLDIKYDIRYINNVEDPETSYAEFDQSEITRIEYRVLPVSKGSLTVGTTVPVLIVPYIETSEPLLISYDAYYYVGHITYDSVQYDAWYKIEDPEGVEPEYNWSSSTERWLYSTPVVYAGPNFIVDTNGNLTAYSINILGGKLNIVGANASFEVTDGGVLIAKAANISGNIKALSGEIATFKIVSNSIQSGNPSVTNKAFVYLGTDAIRVGGDASHTYSYPFYLGTTGRVNITLPTPTSPDPKISDTDYKNSPYVYSPFTLTYTSSANERKIRIIETITSGGSVKVRDEYDIILPANSTKYDGELSFESRFISIYPVSGSSEEVNALLTLKFIPGFVVDSNGDVVMRQATMINAIVKGSFIGDVNVTSGSITIKDSNNVIKFNVDQNGNLTAKDASLTNASVSGSITTSSGTIAGFEINDTYITSGPKPSNWDANGVYLGNNRLLINYNNTSFSVYNGSVTAYGIDAQVITILNRKNLNDTSGYVLANMSSGRSSSPDSPQSRVRSFYLSSVNITAGVSVTINLSNYLYKVVAVFFSINENDQSASVVSSARMPSWKYAQGSSTSIIVTSPTISAIFDILVLGY